MGEPAIMRLPAVLERVGLSRTTLWRRIRDGSFPQPVRLGGEGSRAVGWYYREVENWVEARRPAAGHSKSTPTANGASLHLAR